MGAARPPRAGPPRAGSRAQAAGRGTPGWLIPVPPPPRTDPHYASGPPNLADCAACKLVGGRSWETVGQIWYRALTGFGPSPHMSMKDFAKRTRQLAAQMYNATVAAAVDKAWKQVGL